jgi:membrane associated rhomboid family serine protease
VTAPELSVVCKSCGSEVSPYVTECPYCGHRLRKRAPELEREGDEIKVREGWRERRRRLRRERRERREEEEPRPGRRRMPSFGAAGIGERPLATISVLLVAAVLLVLERAVPWTLSEVGAIVGPVGSDWWRYLAAPFVYDDLGALIVTGGAIAIFGSAVEGRIGSLATLTLIVACGTGGMLAADAAATAGLDDFLVAAGGNGVALGLLGAWVMLRRAEARTSFSDPVDLAGVSVAAVVLLLLPLVEVTADPIGGLVGGLVGVVLGALAASKLSPGDA